MPFVVKRNVVINLKHKRNELDGTFTLQKKQNQPPSKSNKRDIIIADVVDEKKFFIIFDKNFR